MRLIVLNIYLFFLWFYHAFLSNCSKLNELSMLSLTGCFNGAYFSELSMLSLSNYSSGANFSHKTLCNTTIPVTPVLLQGRHILKKKNISYFCCLQSISSNQPNSYLICRKRYSQDEANDKGNMILLQCKRERESVKVRVNVHHVYMWKAWSWAF